MDLSVILTYRCDSKCSMCNVWQNPTHPEDEVKPETLAKLPCGFDYLNITGGEPTLRNDLFQVVEILYPKTKTLEISTNGLHPDRLAPIVAKYPGIKIRISLEGLEDTNNRVRGEKDGYRKKMEAMDRLIALGGKDLGFATTFQDENIHDIVEMYRLTRKLNVELATSAIHNGFQFHKDDNFLYDRSRVAKEIEILITEMLRSSSVKNWFRAYLNLGLIAKILGQDRLMPCTAGTDFIFVDPWSNVYACNVRPDLLVGNLETQSWEDISRGDRLRAARASVAACTQNCWMVASAKTAMRTKTFARLPKLKPLLWVLENKIRVSLGLPIPFSRYVDYTRVYRDSSVVQRESYYGKIVKRNLLRRTDQFRAAERTFLNR